MALIQCKECTKEVSTAARLCPHCGAKLKMHPLWWVVIVPGAAFAVVLAIGFSIPKHVSEARQMREACETMIGGRGSPRQHECDYIYQSHINKAEEALENRARRQ